MPLLTANERIGTVLKQKYRLDRILGEGGMGVVFAAVNLATGRQVAVKLLHPENLRASQTVVRFLDEARAASSVRHPNVVDVLDLDTAEDGAPFIVMEFLRGETLRARFDREGPLAPADGWRILRPAMRAIAAAHEAGVVHRDLKPENVFLHDNGDGVLVTKVVDFGIARIGNARRTATGTQIGTPVYMSPEQARGADIGPWSDVWAMGVIWFEALAGRLPFDFPRDATDAALLAHVISNPPMRLAEQGAHDHALVRAVDQALGPSRAERFTNMSAFEAAIADALGDASSLRAPATATRESAGRQVQRTVRLDEDDARDERAPRSTTMALVQNVGRGGALLFIVVAVIASWLLVRACSPNPPPPSAPAAPADAGVLVDAAVSVDAAMLVDAAAPVDAAMPVDAAVSAPRPRPAGAVHPLPGAASETGMGEFDQQAVVRMIQTRRSAIQACYDRELARDPTIAGRIAIQMTIQEGGSVTDVHASENTTGSPAVAACVVRVVQGFRFNPGPAGGIVTYTFPFGFEPE